MTVYINIIQLKFEVDSSIRSTVISGPKISKLGHLGVALWYIVVMGRYTENTEPIFKKN